MNLNSDPESYQLNDLWQVFIDPERRENAKKVRKLLVDRYNLIEGKFLFRTQVQNGPSCKWTALKFTFM